MKEVNNPTLSAAARDAMHRPEYPEPEAPAWQKRVMTNGSFSHPHKTGEAYDQSDETGASETMYYTDSTKTGLATVDTDANFISGGLTQRKNVNAL